MQGFLLLINYHILFFIKFIQNYWNVTSWLSKDTNKYIFFKTRMIYQGCKDFLISGNYANLPKENWLDFYVLARSSVNFGPILDFKVSTDS